MTAVRSLVIVLGDQLDLQAAAFDDFDTSQDLVWMAEVEQESTQVWSAKQRITMFLSAMRHFRDALIEIGRSVRYVCLDSQDNQGNLGAQLQKDITDLKPARLIMTEPGDWRVLHTIKMTASHANLTLDIREDRHFFVSQREFAEYAAEHKSLRMEYFYRKQRKRHRILMAQSHTADEPEGGQWNFDSDNRAAFSVAGPGFLPPRSSFQPDAVTQQVIALVNTRFADHPGQTENFAWPVTRVQALKSLNEFIDNRLILFGRYQDALWPGEVWLYHSHISAALNLKLLQPREVVAAAELAYRAGRVELASAEGFIRQILGWREYVRGIYWTQMPSYLERNQLDAHLNLPDWYWTGDTDMACLRDAITQTLKHGYAHHIQRLMVTGLYALLLGVEPRQVHEWYLAVYVDAVEWVELPNTLGMSQYADGGLMASKPYIASGKYIQRMSPYCKGCRFDPALKTGDNACPFTTLYWNFLIRYKTLLMTNPRMTMQVKNLARLSEEQQRDVQEQATKIRTAKVTL